jgi:osmoprotectant transport system permease protein
VSYALSHLRLVGTLTLQHVELVAVALAIAIAVALPLGLWIARRPNLDAPIIGALSALYTIPSLALLALLVRFVGLGFWTAVIVLVIYAQYVLVRSIAIGLRSVPRAAVDAADGLGMTSSQRLRRVEFPLAFAVMLGGVRVATVAMIAIATLAAYASAGGLGQLIFEGLSRQYPQETLAGSIPAAILAIAVDTVLRAVERAAAPWTLTAGRASLR